MNREIKFRAWDGEIMHYNVSINPRWGAIKEGYGATSWKKNSNAGMPMQYTGLKDKNGREIYEGDLLKADEYATTKGEPIGDVVFLEKYAVWYVEGTINDGLGDLIIQSNVEVIGNIYENPELIAKIES